MKEIKVQIKERNILELLEDANKGDLINLAHITSVDMELLTSKIENSFKEILDKEVENAINANNIKVQNEISSYKERIVLLTKEKEDIKVITLNEEKNKNSIEKLDLENKFKLEESNLKNTINNLNSELNSIKDSLSKQFELELKTKLAEVKELEIKKIEGLEKEKQELLLKQSEYNKDIEILKKDKEQQEEFFKLKLEKELSVKVSEVSNKYKEDLLEKEKQINNLTNQRSIKNVKQTGEDLESWCDLEVRNFMQNGLFNCTWSKDNLVVKQDDDTKGSKADFIFNIYADDTHNTLLSNICLEMKDENPDSIYKKKNEDYYKQLDKNRTKKGCKYALLVSTLEIDKPNDLPIYKVNEFSDMYVIRPAYLMTFINMIVSLTVNFKRLLLEEQRDIIEFKSSADLLEEFDSIKNTYLDKPLKLLEKEIANIKSASSSIVSAAEKINTSCESIKIKYIEEIENKIERFNINKLIKKVDKHDN